MNQLLENLREQFKDEEYRNSYVEDFLNSSIAAQIKSLREQREMTQQQLAEKIGTKQSGIARLENINYSAWKTETLVKLARAFHLRLKVTFEEFGTLPPEISLFNRKSLERRSFEKDPVFNPSSQAPVASEGLTMKPVSPSETHSGGVNIAAARGLKTALKFKLA